MNGKYYLYNEKDKLDSMTYEELEEILKNYLNKLGNQCIIKYIFEVWSDI